MKRYLLFCCFDYYPSGGWRDFVGSYDSVELALEGMRNCDRWYIVDSKVGQIVKDSKGDKNESYR